jgi:type III pantothenate kinase
MILCLDVGNTHIYAGLFIDHKLHLQFRYPSSTAITSDQLGVFFKSVLRENDIEPSQIKQVIVCSVVPSLDYSLRAAFLKYFSLGLIFLKNDTVPSLKIDYKNPNEIGADRISNAVAAIDKFPGKDLLIVDLGTATTFDAVTADKTYLGGAIIPGIYISMKALYENTAKLSPVNIVKPTTVLGESTIENIQAGLYFSHLGAARQIIEKMTQDVFHNKKPFVIGTGGFAYLFEDEHLFDAIVPDLVLHGLYLAAKTFE